MENVEQITWKGKTLAFVVRFESTPKQTIFFTPPDFNFQMGFVVYPAGTEIARHVHIPISRHVVGTSEVLFVKKGYCLIDFYDEDRQLVATRELRTGDVVLMVGGGHGIRVVEDTVFVEIKQGPYLGMDEKERF